MDEGWTSRNPFFPHEPPPPVGDPPQAPYIELAYGIQYPGWSGVDNRAFPSYPPPLRGPFDGLEHPVGCRCRECDPTPPAAYGYGQGRSSSFDASQTHGSWYGQNPGWYGQVSSPFADRRVPAMGRGSPFGMPWAPSHSYSWHGRSSYPPHDAHGRYQPAFRGAIPHSPLRDDLFCDYSHCPKRDEPFRFPDELRHHLATYHKEDVEKRRGSVSPGRRRSSGGVKRGWVRCDRCLHKVKLENRQKSLQRESEQAEG
jgi:hypothetical protein